MDLKFYVKNQTLVRKNRPLTASGSKNYLFAAFRFSSEWSGTVKTAVFVSADGLCRYHMLIENGRCAVPSELIQKGGFYVSVFGGDRITSSRVFVDVSESGIEPGLTPPEPSEDIYAQITDKIGELSEAVENVSMQCPDNYIETAMIKDGAVTTAKIADNAVTAAKLADGAVTAESVVTASGGDVQSAIDDIDRALNGGEYDGEVTPLSSCCDNAEFGYYSFIGDIDNELVILNDLTADDYPAGESGSGHMINHKQAVNDENGLQWLFYEDVDTADKPVWLFSQKLKKGGTYRVKITKEPQRDIDWWDGIIEVEEEIYINNGINNRVSALETAVGAANAALETLLTEGV